MLNIDQDTGEILNHPQGVSMDEHLNNLANIADSKNDEEFIEKKLSYDEQLRQTINEKLANGVTRLTPWEKNQWSSKDKALWTKLRNCWYTKKYYEERNAHGEKRTKQGWVKGETVGTPQKRKKPLWTQLPEGATQICHTIVCPRNRAFIIQRGENILLAFEGDEYTVEQVREFVSGNTTIPSWKKTDIFTPAESLMGAFKQTLAYAMKGRHTTTSKFNVGDHLHELIFKPMVVEEVIITAEGVKYRVADMWEASRDGEAIIDEKDAYVISSLEQEEILKLARG